MTDRSTARAPSKTAPTAKSPADRLVLAFDTSGPHCTAALLGDDSIIGATSEDMGRGQSEHLFPLLESLLREAGLRWRDLSALAVGVGPGNFTGIRIAVAAARGVAMGLRVPAIGVSTFEALREGCDTAAVLCSVAAPRGMVYLQAGDASPFGPILPDALPSLYRHKGLPVIGAEAEALSAVTGGEVLRPVHALAPAIARAAAKRATRQTQLPQPLYIRSADAAPSRDVPPVLLDE